MLKTICLSTAASAAAFGIAPARVAARGASRTAGVDMATFYDFSANTIDGKETSMGDFKGKPVLILNVASL